MNKKDLCFLTLFSGILLFGVTNSLWAQTPKIDEQNFKINKNLDIFSSILKETELFYVDTINTDESVSVGIKSMLSTLDPYTNYFTEAEKEGFETMTTGEYGGIGSVIMEKNGEVFISEPYENMPAQLAGLKAGDKLLKINDIDLKGKKSSDVSDLLKGEPNTTFRLTFQRSGEEKSKTIDITRKKIQINPVTYYGVISDSIGYIFLSSFTDKAAKEVRTALTELKNNPKVTSFVLDLRNNTGGILEDAIQIVNLFVPKGKEVLSTRGKVKQWDKTYKTTQEPIDTQTPLVVLTNSLSASASEIVAGALQDLDRAVIIGERTYGKGLVQTTRALPYGGLLKVTTAKYYIPSGRCIQAIDYAQRNPDGSIGRIPDSLTTAFNTANGRIVRDGGGIKPDIEVSQKREPNIGYYLFSDNLIFDFATDYVSKHKTIAPIEDFELTDAEYDDFKNFVKSKNFTYDKQSEKALESLRNIAKFEGYLEDSENEFKALEAKLKHNLDKDLDIFKPEIKQLIATELANRYYFQKGEIIQSLKRDDVLDKTKEILSGKDEYKKILQPQKKDEK